MKKTTSRLIFISILFALGIQLSPSSFAGAIPTEKPNDVFIETNPERSAGEPSIAAHPYNPNLVLGFERG